MKLLHMSTILLVGALTYGSLYSMGLDQNNVSWQDRISCIASLLRLTHTPGEQISENMIYSIIRTNGLNMALMAESPLIIACAHTIQRSFGCNDITAILGQDRAALIQCIADALQYVYAHGSMLNATDKANLRQHAQAIMQLLLPHGAKRSTPDGSDIVIRAEGPAAKQQHMLSETTSKTIATPTNPTLIPESQVPLWEHPYLIQYIAKFLTLKDRFRYACTSKTIYESLQQPTKNEHLQIFMREIVDPINYVRSKALVNKKISINGISYTTQEVLDFLYANIATVLINNVYNPILYVLEQAHGSSNVEIYGKHFNTNQLIEDLYKHGADVNRVCDRSAEGSFRENLGCYASRHEINLPSNLDTVPVAQAIRETLNAEQKLDLAQWHLVEGNLPVNFYVATHADHFMEPMNKFWQELIDQCTHLKQQYPEHGIVIAVKGHCVLTQDIIRKLSEFNIVALMLSHAVMPDGVEHIAQLQHLRELFLVLEERHFTDDGFRALCNLSQLRALTIRPEYGSIQGPFRHTMPQEIKNLKKLRFLDVRDFHIPELPREIGQLEQLRLLAICSGSEIRILTPELSLLKNLLILKIGWEQTNKNTAIARSFITHLKKLRELYVDSCSEITDLGETLRQLSNLRILGTSSHMYGGDTSAAVLSDNICLLPALEKLKIFRANLPGFCTFTLLQYCADHGVELWINDDCVISKSDQNLQEMLALRQRLVADEVLAEIPGPEKSLHRYNLCKLRQLQNQLLLDICYDISPLLGYISRHREGLKKFVDKAVQQNQQALQHINQLRSLLHTHKEIYAQILRNDVSNAGLTEHDRKAVSILLSLLGTPTVSELLAIVRQGWLPSLQQQISRVNTQALQRIHDLRSSFNKNKETYTSILRNDSSDPILPEHSRKVASILLGLLDTPTISQEHLWIVAWLPLLEKYIQDIQERERFVEHALL